MFVAEMGEIEGLGSGIRQHFPGRAGSRGMGQDQLVSRAFRNTGIHGPVWHAPTGLGAFWNMSTEVARMMRQGWPRGWRPSIESLRELRLRALLNDLVKDVGPGRLAEQFGVDRKTLWRWQRAAELPPRLAETLERMLLERAVAAMAEVNGDGKGAEVDNAVIDALRQEFAQEIQRLDRPGRRRTAATPPAAAPRMTGPGHSGAMTTWLPGSRPSDDEQVYGTAWPLVEEWRELLSGHPPPVQITRMMSRCSQA